MKYYLEELREKIALEVAQAAEVPRESVVVESANDKIGSDLAIPCFALAKHLKKNPQEIAEQLSEILSIDEAEKIEGIAGFVNIWLKPRSIADGLFATIEICKKAGHSYGDVKDYEGQVAVTEYTDPNPFKEFHIGHIYSNTVGESLSRLYEAAGAEVHRVSYHGDVGLQIGKALWGMRKILGERDIEIDDLPEGERVEFLGKAYVQGSTAHDNDDKAREEIVDLNKQVYEKSNSYINHIYKLGREWSFDYFESMYERLGVGFEKKYLESETVDIARQVVREGLAEQVFENSDGAVVFVGENYGLHTRVFINSRGLPTYEAKDLGLATLKHQDYQYDQSVILTGNEQDTYFKVVLQALSLLRPELAESTVHMSHGMVRMTGGKMSSRAGNILTADSLLNDVEGALRKGTPESPSIKENTLAAIKYAFLKQAVGGDIVFDIDESISLEGNSGPYVQYAAVRVSSVLAKAGDRGEASEDYSYEAEKNILLKLAQFPDVVSVAVLELAPHVVATYVFELAKEWNRYYEKVNILESEASDRAARLAILEDLYSVFEKSLHLLGITIPEQM